MSSTLLPPDYVPSGDDEFMNPLMTEFFRQRLMEWRNELLRESGFSINYNKSRIVGAGSRQIVAGLVVNSAGLPSRVRRRRWRALFYKANLSPDSYQGRGAHLAGIAAFVNQYDSSMASRYRQIARRVQLLDQEH